MLSGINLFFIFFFPSSPVSMTENWIANSFNLEISLEGHRAQYLCKFPVFLRSSLGIILWSALFLPSVYFRPSPLSLDGLVSNLTEKIELI